MKKEVAPTYEEFYKEVKKNFGAIGIIFPKRKSMTIYIQKKKKSAAIIK